MQVKMRVKITGTRDGSDWPDPGGVVDLPEDEARQLLGMGAAVEVALAPAPEVPAPKRGRSRAPKPESR